MTQGFAFIYMEDERDAVDAIRELDRREFGREGRRLRVEWTKQERGIRRPGGSGGSRRSLTNTRPSKTLFVINFDPYHSRTRDLERHFDPYGKIVNVRIRKNFAFVQYESQEDASRALEATNMSKLMDKVISVEFADRDDDERRYGCNPDRSHDRSLERGHDRRRSQSPYQRERASPDYGCRASPYKRERGSLDYGRGQSPSPYRKERTNPDYGRGRSRIPSPYRREIGGSEHGRGRHSPYKKEKVSDDHIASPSNGRDHSISPYKRDKSPENGRVPSRNSGRVRANAEIGGEPSPNSLPDTCDSPNYGGPDSPMNDRYNSHSPQVEE